MNSITLCGNVGSEVEVRSTTQGKKVCNFSLATSERFKDKASGELKSVTDWHNIVMWDPLSAVAEKYIRKGSKVLISGKSKSRAYESNGQKRFITEVIADHLELLGEKPHAAQTPVVESSGVGTDNGTDLPF